MRRPSEPREVRDAGNAGAVLQSDKLEGVRSAAGLLLFFDDTLTPLNGTDTAITLPKFN